MGNTFAPNLSSSTVVVTANRSGMSQEFDENIVDQLTAYMTPEFYKLFGNLMIGSMMLIYIWFGWGLKLCNDY